MGETLRLEDVATFVHAVDAGSFAAAGQHLGVPKGTVSRRVARLEQALGEELITRHARLFRLTDVGRGLYDRSAHAVHELLQATRDIRGAHGDVSGELRISVPPDFGASAPLLGLFAAFTRAHPAVVLFVDLSDRRVDLMAERFDFALRAHTQLLEDTTTLRARPVARSVEIRLYASHAYLHEQGTPKTLDDLLAHETVGFERAGTDLGWSLRPRTGKGREVQMAVRPRIRFTSFPSMLGAALQGVGVAPLPDAVAAEHVAAGGLVPVLEAWMMTPVHLSLLWPASRLPHPRRRAFLDFVTAHPPFPSPA